MPLCYFNVFIWYVCFFLSSCLVIWDFCFLSSVHNLRTFWMIILHRYIQSGTWSTNAWALHLNWETNGHMESIINIFTEMTKYFSSMFDLIKKETDKENLTTSKHRTDGFDTAFYGVIRSQQGKKSNLVNFDWIWINNAHIDQRLTVKFFFSCINRMYSHLYLQR